ncbi:peptidylprolyl isomerase [Roseibaca sp. Y0-43]|uniref:peptidylprolyl isomerase n=1 Tax=Roseibaca sp. Y0-43 TaxID=2816854 RepID=UPI001D0C9E5E|nr:peptidylprolyl isomerase [Roseibaca sp. Y0-43]MCC1480100.1 peptidylprolyl isomerase [Roseibaca sp. Y0-43]
MRNTFSLRASFFGMALAAFGALHFAAAPALADNPFAPARKVGDRIITEYDVSQRITFLELLNVGAEDMREEALSRLTEEAMQRAYAQRRDVRLTSEELAEGMAEFASRANLETDAFIAELANGGVDRESFVSFVEAGLLWRKVVGNEYSLSTVVTTTDVQRARDVAAIRGTKRVLISEIFLPADPEFAEPVAQIIGLIENARTIEEFSAIAREYSLAGTRDQGGRLDWLPLTQLPGQISGPLSAASPGEIIGPIELNGAIAFFQLRAEDSTRLIPANQVKLTYKRLLLPGGRSPETLATYAEIQARVQHCNGLDPYAAGLPENYLTETEALMQSIPQSDAVELARLDRFEMSANTVEGGNLVVLMLCARELELEERPSDIQVENGLFNARLGGRAQLKLDELIADTVIVDY